MKKKNVSILSFLLLILGLATTCTIFTGCEQETSSNPEIKTSEIKEFNLADDLYDLGLRVERIYLHKSIAQVYFYFKKDFSETLILSACDAAGKELGRSKLSIKGKIDEAIYTNFQYDSRIPSQAISHFRITKALAPIATEVPAIEEKSSTNNDPATETVPAIQQAQ